MPGHVYLSCTGDNEIRVLALNSRSGALTLEQTVSLTGLTGQRPLSPDVDSMPLALSPDRRFLYAAVRYERFHVASFAIDPVTGRLRYLGIAPLAEGMVYLAVDGRGRWLMGASYRGSVLAINPIGADGIVRAPPSQVRLYQQNAHCVRTDPSNRFLHAALHGDDIVVCHAFDASDGRMAAEPSFIVPFEPSVGPRHIQFHPNARFAYVNTELGGRICAFAIEATGRWTRIQDSAAMPEDFQRTAHTADLQITPDGRFLYMSERILDLIAIFAVDPDSGRLESRGFASAEKGTRTLAISPDGRILLAAGQHSHHMTVFAIDDATGALASKFRYATGRNPNWIEIVDSRRAPGALPAA